MDPTHTSATGAMGAFTWLASWMIMIFILIGLAQTEWGKRIVYYVAWLSLLFLIVTHSNEFTALLGNFAADRKSVV